MYCRSIGASSPSEGNTKFFTWLTDPEAEAKKVKLRVHGSHAAWTEASEVEFRTQTYMTHIASFEHSPVQVNPPPTFSPHIPSKHTILP